MAKSFKYKNNIYLDSSGITHNRKVLKDVLEKNIIILNLNTDLECKTLNDFTKVTNLGEYFKRGTKLTSSNNEIIIGEGVSLVMVSVKMSWYCESAGLKHMGVSQNSSRVVSQPQTVTSKSYASTYTYNFPVNVTQGDRIFLQYRTETSGDVIKASTNTYLTVEVIK